MTSLQGQNDVRNLSAYDIETDKAEQKKKWRQRLSKFFSREDSNEAQQRQSSHPPSSEAGLDPEFPAKPRTGFKFPRQVIPGLPRPGTFRRQLSERRERLSPAQADNLARRTLSCDRRREFPQRSNSSSAIMNPRTSAPAVYEISDQPGSTRPLSVPASLPQQPNMDAMLMQRPTGPPTPPPDTTSHITDDPSRQAAASAVNIQAELESRWILNLSMHFRDKSPREKFFVTYAETPTRWRRVTVSCDYRNASPESLEADLRNLPYQRDKSARIYEAIRASLPDIKFYDTVTNLRLETSADERLHVHVTEDVNEIIPYPDKHLLQHLDYTHLKRVSESDVHFISHMSGFVYKVKVDGEILIKKEIPGPDSVEEFLYETNALNALQGSQHVVQIRGLVLDDNRATVTGLLIDYYEQGPLVDVLFDHKGDLTWERRVKWATQIIQGLSEIHEAGYVQGDFTVSNVCITKEDNARIIDINRRGCPVGWEPPEIACMIDSGQRISMYIGVKSDLFQLGMVLWALAMEDDEPERKHRPLRLPVDPDLQIPGWYRELTHLCLEPDPKDRLSAAKLLTLTRQPSSLSLAKTRRASSTALSAHLSTQISNNPPNPQHFHLSADNPRTDEGVSDGVAHRRSISRVSVTCSSSDDEGPRGRSPPRNVSHLNAPWSRNLRSVTSGIGTLDPPTLDPELVSISPSCCNQGQSLLGEARNHELDMLLPYVSDQEEQRQSSYFAESSAPEPSTLANLRPRSADDIFDDRPLAAMPYAPQPPFSYHGMDHVDSGSVDQVGLFTPAFPAIDRHARMGMFDLSGNLLDTPEDYNTQSLGSFLHHDSGLGDMDVDVVAGAGMNEELINLGLPHLSGRRRWNMDPTDRNCQGRDDRLAQATISRQTAGEQMSDLDHYTEYESADDEMGDHHGGVSIGNHAGSADGNTYTQILAQMSNSYPHTPKQ